MIDDHWACANLAMFVLSTHWAKHWAKQGGDTLHTVHCTQWTLHCSLYRVYCIQCTVHCTLYTVVQTRRGSWARGNIPSLVQPRVDSTTGCCCQMGGQLEYHNHSLHCSGYTVQCKSYSLQCTVYSTHCTVLCLVVCVLLVPVCSPCSRPLHWIRNSIAMWRSQPRGINTLTQL